MYRFHDGDFVQAFIHPSAGEFNNQRLAWIGRPHPDMQCLTMLHTVCSACFVRKMILPFKSIAQLTACKTQLRCR